MKVERGMAYLTAEEMREFDRRAVEEFGVDELFLMENAGRAVAELGRRVLGGDAKGKSVLCLSGKGNNGGDALVTARHLHGWGTRVVVVLAVGRNEVRETPERQLRVLEKIGVPIVADCSPVGHDLIVDGLLGYGSTGDPRGRLADLIRQANWSGIPIVSVDIPSGLDATSGNPGDPTIRARATLTLGLPKTGFLNPDSLPFVGELFLADISFPAQLYVGYPEMLGVFSRNGILKVP